jgi:hypothetical protein
MPLPPWSTNDDRVVLFHGCLAHHAADISMYGVDLNQCDTRTDFGRGFYLTTLEKQARTFAEAKARSPNNFPVSGPAVVRFRIPWSRLAVLESISFVVPNDDGARFWRLVKHCRALPPTPEGTHKDPPNRWYDIAMGPVALRWQNEERVARPHSDQISFHTQRAVDILNELIEHNDGEGFKIYNFEL